jgi:predicted Mrr-cat superfamily restriction endonuclease
VQAFVCRIKPDGKTDITDQALKESAIYYGLADMRGLLEPTHTVESIRATVAALHPEYIPLREAKMFWDFSRTMRSGALLLVPKKKLPKERFVSYYLAEAVGETYADERYVHEHTMYRRNVRWLNNQVPVQREELPIDLINMINQPYNVRKTCVDVSAFAGDVLKLVA